MDTESALGDVCEWVIELYNQKCILLARVCGNDKWFLGSNMWRAWNVPQVTVIKAYTPDKCDFGILDVEIGYCERRLTVLERLNIRLYLIHYWDIPY